MNGRFRPGAHIRVWRGLYYHHGIYVSDERVIQLGRGIFDKPSASIEAVSIECFEAGRTAGVTPQGRDSWITGYHPPADEPWKVIARAEFLLKRQPRLKYNLIGHNCEHIANMCASGGWTESYQTRRFFAARAAMDMVLMLWISCRSRAKLPIPQGFSQR